MMDFARLKVVHQPKGQAGHDLVLVSEARFGEALRVDTCQRRFWVSFDPCMSGGESFSGTDAYRFLLRVVTGLESQVKGEADIFGQFKEQWQNYERSEGRWARMLVPLIQKLFEDAKDIRSRYLQHAGTGSYGSLVRKILRNTPGEAGPVLLVGAGRIAKSIAPWLVENPLWIWNRSSTKAESFSGEIQERFRVRARVIVGADEGLRAWREARHAILCIPADVPADELRVAAWREGARPHRSVIHLGAMRAEAGVWNTVPEFHPLDDLFALQKQSDASRAVQFERAIKACDEKAILRSLGGSATLPHGWEDLAVFA